MRRAYYSDSIDQFVNASSNSIMGELVARHGNRNLEKQQVNAWKKQIEILKEQLQDFQGQIYFEFAIPRMGKRADNIVIIEGSIFVLEFKVGSNSYERAALDQVIDYVIDLINFHEGSHKVNVVPVLVATNADLFCDNNSLNICELTTAAKSNSNNLASILRLFLSEPGPRLDVNQWESSAYKPTPTIVEAAQALYKGHNVSEITRSDAGAINLSKTTDYISRIIESSKQKKVKSICFVTGVPGAGKTLAGLNITSSRMNVDESENAVFLSGNGPLVEVLREALSRDEVETSKLVGEKVTKKDARRKANAFIQNIHHFRDEGLLSENPPVEKVVVFDEAQRAWNRHQTSSFMKQKKGLDNFDKSEPHFLIDVMNRHEDWCVIVCLIGGGQEINKGEAGLEEWVSVIRDYYPTWQVHYSTSIINDGNYLKTIESKEWLEINTQTYGDFGLHLAVSVRSFRSERLSDFVHELLELRKDSAIALFKDLQQHYPIVLTRDLQLAKRWLRERAKGTERIGIVASSGARRLRAYGIDVKNEIKSSDWFLNDKDDVRSSCSLEVVATEFKIQGLEVDWACVAWGGNFYYDVESWNYQAFKGTKWQQVRNSLSKAYLKNAYRVLLTRARQGMVLFIPEGNVQDKTRCSGFYDGTYSYLKSLGIPELKV